MNDNHAPLNGPDTATGTIEDQSEDWLIYLYSGAATEEGLKRFGTWMAAHAAHAAAYARTEQLWRDLGYTDGDVEADVQAPLIDHTLSVARRRAEARHPTGAFVLAACACAAVIAASAWLFYDPVTSAKYVSAPGDVRTIVLPDGSQATLGGNTVLISKFSKRRRNIELADGRVFFAVQKDKARPFIVKAEGVDVTVTGTRFDVRKDPAQVQVSVIEGHVKVGTAGSDTEVALSVGDRVVATRDWIGHVGRFETDEVAGWQQGQLIYNGAKLSDVVAEVNRYRSQKIVVVDPALNDLPVSLIIPIKQTDRLLSALAIGEGVMVLRTPAEVRLSRHR